MKTTEPILSRSAYPVAIVQDRYQGSFSRGRWIAIACADDPELGGSILAKIDPPDDEETESPWGSDIPAINFWHDPPDFVAVGDTPQAALDALKARGWEE